TVCQKGKCGVSEQRACKNSTKLVYSIAGGTMAGEKRSMTLTLSDAEMRVLENLAQQKDLSKTALMRQALRLYQLVDARLSVGSKLYFEDEHKGEKAELMVL